MLQSRQQRILNPLHPLLHDWNYYSRKSSYNVCFQLFQWRGDCFVVAFLISVLVHNSVERSLKKVINSIWSPSTKNCPKIETEGF
jgi:hypothetical protein